MDSLGDVTLGYWKRYGKERVYANGVNGSRLGFIDLATGEVTLEPGSDPRVEEVLRSWRPEGALAPASSTADDVEATAPADGAATRADVSREPAARAWTDLAQNRPGAGVRAEAEAAWAARKDRSKFWAYTGRILNVHTDERAWRVGAEGEEAIGARLDKLRDHGWRVLHSVPVGERGSDIDHILIGPGGVFTVNSKNHPGGKIWVAKYQMRVNGQVVPYLRNARHEAQRASRLLTTASGVDVSVRSCVVILTGTIVPEVNIKQMPDDVMVLDRMDIPRWFKRRSATLSERSIERIFEAARRSTTWTTLN